MVHYCFFSYIVIVSPIACFLENGDISYRYLSHWKFPYRDKSRHGESALGGEGGEGALGDPGNEREDGDLGGAGGVPTSWFGSFCALGGVEEDVSTGLVFVM